MDKDIPRVARLQRVEEVIQEVRILCFYCLPYVKGRSEKPTVYIDQALNYTKINVTQPDLIPLCA